MHSISERRKQKLKHYCIVGYDPVSERSEYSLKVSQSKIDLLKRFVTFESDDPEGYDCYKVEYSDIVKLLDLLGHSQKPPETFDYFVEPWTQK
jgi:hypothetical protein